jgi:hypothetical protein
MRERSPTQEMSAVGHPVACCAKFPSAESRYDKSMKAPIGADLCSCLASVSVRIANILYRYGERICLPNAALNIAPLDASENHLKRWFGVPMHTRTEHRSANVLESTCDSSSLGSGPTERCSPAIDERPDARADLLTAVCTATGHGIGNGHRSLPSHSAASAARLRTPNLA